MALRLLFELWENGRERLCNQNTVLFAGPALAHTTPFGRRHLVRVRVASAAIRHCGADQ